MTERRIDLAGLVPEGQPRLADFLPRPLFAERGPISFDPTVARHRREVRELKRKAAQAEMDEVTDPIYAQLSGTLLALARMHAPVVTGDRFDDNPPSCGPCTYEDHCGFRENTWPCGTFRVIAESVGADLSAYDEDDS